MLLLAIKCTAAVIVCLHNWNICLWHIKIIIYNCKKACHIRKVNLCLSLQSKQFVDEEDSPAMCLVQSLWTGTPRQVPLHLYPIQLHDVILTLPPLLCLWAIRCNFISWSTWICLCYNHMDTNKKETLSDPLKSS